MDWHGFLAKSAFALSVIVAFTALLDLFVNRLLFRAGPEVLTHLQVPGLAQLAVAGRIAFTFQQIALYLILGSAAILLASEGEALLLCLSLLLLPQLVCAAILYFPIPLALAWGVSMLLVLVTVVEVVGLLLMHALRKPDSATEKSQWVERGFLLALALSFVFPIYYRISLLVAAVSSVPLPFEAGAYDAGIFMVMIAAAAALAYAFIVPSPGFKTSIRNIAKALVLPTILVGPIFYGLMESYFMVQIFSLVIAMSTDITPSFELVRALVFFWWVLLVAIMLLILKGQACHRRFLIQQALGLVIILSTTFLFNYPNYLLLGTTGVLLLAYSLQKPVNERNS
jgi:hypothetical protein